MQWGHFSFDTIQQRQLLLKLLESVKLFTGFTQDELLELLTHTEKSVYPAGVRIIGEGEEGTFMYIILAGQVRIAKRVEGGAEKDLTTLNAGECFGEMALVDHRGRSASVHALSDCTLLRLAEQDPWNPPELGTKLYRNIARLLSQRLRHTNAMISLGMDDH